MKCPKCGYGNSDTALSCGLCSGLLQETNTIIQEKEFVPPKDKSGKIPYELIIFLIGLLAYPFINSLYFLDLMCSYLTTLIHEIGHTIMFLVFGYIAIPKFDFVYGGGMAVPVFHSGVAGPIIITGLLGLLAYLNRKHTAVMITLLIIATVYPILAFTKGQDVLIAAAGHLCEAVGAGVCFYRCLVAGNALPFERPIYVVIGWWITIHGIRFCWQLGTDLAARTTYLYHPKGYPDLARITDSTNWSFGFITVIFAVCYFIPAVLSVVLIIWKIRKTV